MTDTVEADIALALMRHLDEAVFSVSLPIAWPGRQFTPPAAGGPFLAGSVQFLPVRQVTFGDDGSNRYAGLLTVLLSYSNDAPGFGVLEPLRLAAEVIARFRRGTAITEGARSVRMIEPPYMSDPMQDGARINIPVTVRWQSDNLNVAAA